MQKVIVYILTVIMSYYLFAASRYNECNFLGSEIRKYEYKQRQSRDLDEFNKYTYILEKYRYNFKNYCKLPRSSISTGDPFRSPQQQQQSGYLGR